MPRLATACCALALLLLFPGAAPVRAGSDASATWRDARIMGRHLDEACHAVEAACGAPFAVRPGLRISTQAEVEAIVRRREHAERGIVERAPAGSRSFMAYYEPIGMEVHVLPEEFERVAAALHAPELLDEDLLRVILVHEATHALDFQRFPVKWTLACCARSDERLAIEAVLEGHAQLISQRIAVQWGIEEAFHRLTRLYTGAYSPGGEFDQEAAFAYVQGHAFMQTILDQRGRKGLERVLHDPPCETRIIDHPLLWLEPARHGREPDLQAVLEVFRPLILDPTWTISKWRLLGSSVQQISEAHAIQGADFQGYVDNHGLYAGTTDGGRYLNVFITSWRTPKEATRFVDAIRGVDEARDLEEGWEGIRRQAGAGSELGLPGFTSRRHMTGAAADATLTVHVARQGRHVVEVSSWGIPESERRAQASAIDVAAHFLAARPAVAAAMHLQHVVTALLRAREEGESERARNVLRGLLPSDADLRRVVKSEVATAFEQGYRGHRLELRTTPVSPELTQNVFGGVDSRVRVGAIGATTEELIRGGVEANGFPEPMRAFARRAAYPGTVWLILSITPREGEAPTRYVCFARLGDRFLWIVDPWTVPD